MESRKTIALMNRSFWPDVEATGQLLTELCEYLSEHYTVVVVAGRSYYQAGAPFEPLRLKQKELHKGVHIIRVRNTRLWKGNLAGRLVNWFTYSILAFFSLFRVRADVMIIGTDPPFLGLVALVFQKITGVRFFYLCNDVYPDVAIALGELSEQNVAGKLFNYLNVKALHAAKRIVCLGVSMKERLQKKGIFPDHIQVIPTWVDTQSIKPIEKKDNPLVEKWGLENKFVVVYSGNMGLSQNFDVLLKAISLLDVRLPFIFLFIGQGAGRETLMRSASSLGLSNIKFFPYQPIEMIPFSLSVADLHLVPLKKGIAGAIVPSKVYGILAAGRPYLAVTDYDSEPAILARQYRCGLWVAPEDVNVIKDAFLWAFMHRNELLQMGQRARLLAEERFDRHRVIAEWFSLLSSIL